MTVLPEPSKPVSFMGVYLFQRLYPVAIFLLVCIAGIWICQAMPEAIVLLCALWLMYHIVAIPFQWLYQQVNAFVCQLPSYSMAPSFHRKISGLISLGVFSLLVFGLFVLMSASLYPVVMDQYTRLLSSAPQYYESFMRVLHQALTDSPFEPLVQLIETYLPSAVESVETSLPETVSEALETHPLTSTHVLNSAPVTQTVKRISFPIALLGVDGGTPLNYWMDWLQQALLDSWERVASFLSASFSGMLLFVLGVVVLLALLVDARPFKQTAEAMIPIRYREIVIGYCQAVNLLVYRTVWLQWVSVMLSTALVYGILLTFWVGYTEALTVFWGVCSLFPLVGVWFGALGLFVVLLSTQHWGAVISLTIALGLFQFVKARWVTSSWALSSSVLHRRRIHPLVLLMSFAFGVAVLGAGGLFLMVPLGAFLTVWILRLSEEAIVPSEDSSAD